MTKCCKMCGVQLIGKEYNVYRKYCNKCRSIIFPRNSQEKYILDVDKHRDKEYSELSQVNKEAEAISFALSYLKTL